MLTWTRRKLLARPRFRRSHKVATRIRCEGERAGVGFLQDDQVTKAGPAAVPAPVSPPDRIRGQIDVGVWITNVA